MPASLMRIEVSRPLRYCYDGDLPDLQKALGKALFRYLEDQISRHYSYVKLVQHTDCLNEMDIVQWEITDPIFAFPCWLDPIMKEAHRYDMTISCKIFGKDFSDNQIEESEDLLKIIPRRKGQDK